MRLIILLSLAVLISADVKKAAFTNSAPTIMDIIYAGLSTIPKAVYHIRTAVLSPSVKDVFNRGFRRHEAGVQFEIAQGVPRDNVLKFIASNLVQKMNLNPSSILEGVEVAVNIGLKAEQNTWHDVKVAFSELDAKGQVQFVDIIICNGGGNSFNIVVASVAPFQLAPDVKYIHNAKSCIGGYYSATTIERSEYPSELIDIDLQALMEYFHIVVFRKLATGFNMPTPHLPDKLPLK